MSEGSEGPGEVLRAEREALGVTTRDVAETLNLSISMVEAIEANEYERMPAAVFARGYIRAYARLLDLQPEPIVARYPETAGRSDTQEPVQPVGLQARLRRQPQVIVGALGALGLLLLILLAVWVWPASDPAEDASPDDTAPVESEPAAAEALQPGPGADDVGSEAVGGGGEVSGLAESPAEVASEVADPAAVEPASSQPVAVTPDAPAGVDGSAASAGPVSRVTVGDDARRITEFGDDVLRFDFTEDCWVEVKSASGRNLYSDLSKAGTTLELVGEGPFRILLGYAPGAALAFNGEPVPLGPHTRNNVATLVLGQ